MTTPERSLASTQAPPAPPGTVPRRERRVGRDRRAVAPAPRRPDIAANDEQHVVILSGLSGGGKTAAAKLFEDLGYTVVDNLPGEMLPQLAELVSVDRSRFARVAIVLDVRAGNAMLAFAAMRGTRGPRDSAAGDLPRSS
ncbi:MAG TPA: RNase adapter RapZ [Candidatus Limnocylindrales bacterium]|nr:RNase adapter RapZ [Candidatus Limnocylindrales bacterium]